MAQHHPGAQTAQLPPTPTQTDPRRTRLLSGAADAAVDVRKACNGIKRMSSLSAASMVMGMPPDKTVAAAEAMAVEVLRSIGFDVDDAQRMQSVLPMMMEATSLVIADAAYHADSSGLDTASLLQASKFGVGVMSEIAKSRNVAKMVEPAYPADMEATVALRLTAASAMAQVAVEIAEFDFVHSAGECIKEAGKVVVAAAMDAAHKLAPEQASRGARLMLTQSLITSGAKVYAATWRSVARNQIAELDALPDALRELRLDEMGGTSLTKLLVPVQDRFMSAFEGVVQAATQCFETPVENSAPRKSATPARVR